MAGQIHENNMKPLPRLKTTTTATRPARCPGCLSRLNPENVNWEKKINPVIDEASIVASNYHRFYRPLHVIIRSHNTTAGSGIGAMFGAVHAFNIGFSRVQKHAKGQKWFPFVIGLPPLLMISAASAVVGGYVVPKFAQVNVRSYCVASSASHYLISLLTRHVEERRISRIQFKELVKS